MGKLFGLEITLDYNMNTPYNDILWKGDWVQGFAVSFKITVVNKSEFKFNNAVVRVILEEHSSFRSSDLIRTYMPIMVPQLEPGDYFTTGEYEYFPKHDGICEIILESDVFRRKEIIISGSLERKAVKNRISSHYTVVRWQELEIIQLLKKLVTRGENSIQ